MMTSTNKRTGRYRKVRLWGWLTALAAVLFLPLEETTAAKLTVVLKDGKQIRLLGAVQRWDADGNALRLPNPTAKIDEPMVDAKAERVGDGGGVFSNLPPGKYDLVILAEGRLRIEGFQFAPVKEFAPFLLPDALPDEETRKTIIHQIRQSRHYENKVAPLYLAGDTKVVRALIMLIRDQPTSYEGDFPGAATIRHEIWQYSWQYGGWQKEKRTQVLDRYILHRDELRKWTWLWDLKLGGIEVGQKDVLFEYQMPKLGPEKTLPGLYPY